MYYTGAIVYREYIFPPNRALYLISTDQLWYLMNMYANGHHPFNVLSSSVQKEVVGGLLACATGVRKDRYLNEVSENVHVQCTCTL